MLKRSDLAKQFELVVKQEVINHNNQIASTNSAIKELSEDIQKLSDEAENNCAFWSNEQHKVLKEIHRLQSLFDKLNFQVNSNEKSSDEKSRALSIFQDEIRHTLSVLAENISKANSNALKLSEQIARLSCHTAQKQDHINCRFNEIELRFSQNIQAMKDEILGLPSEAEIVKKELLDKLAIAHVDFHGVLKELDAVKKKAFIQEKNIEHIYIQLERLSARLPK